MLKDKLNKIMQSTTKKADDGPLWQGPAGDGPQGGITQGLLGKYVVCRERFRIHTMEGIGPEDNWNHRLGYGNLWHTCEEFMAVEDAADDELISPGQFSWSDKLLEYAKVEAERYPNQQDQIEHWYQVCKVQFPIYVRHWQARRQQYKYSPLMQEQTFDVSYMLPSGRVVRMRGKWDSVDRGREGTRRVMRLQENKTKSEIDGEELTRQLGFDMQTMFYLIALEDMIRATKAGDTDNPLPDECCKYPLVGVRYNVVRRPLSGGKGTIVRHKATKGSFDQKRGRWKTPPKPEETPAEFYKRLGTVIEGMPDDFFQRWNVDVTQEDISTFKIQFLHPVLENLLDDHEWWAYCINLIGQGMHASPFDYGERKRAFPEHTNRIWRYPHGVYNSLLDHGSHELDEYIRSGSTVGLGRMRTLFPELE